MGAHLRRSRVALLSYCLRCGACIGFASMLPVLCSVNATAARLFAVPLFAPVMTAVIMTPKHFGLALKTCTALLCGWLAGAVITSAALAASGSARSNTTTYVSLVLLSLLILFPDTYTPVAQKMARQWPTRALPATRLG